ncbi:MAG: hypothetical protein QXJ31_05350 [Candidatus Bathyarchaeia archaeon]
MGEIPKLTKKETYELEEMKAELEKNRWETEELLLKHNLLEKVLQHKDYDSCPLCGKKFVDGDLCVLSHALIHSKCLDNLKRKKV